MQQPKEVFSYPIVVIESLWPKLPEEAPKLVGPNYEKAPDGNKALNAYLYSDTQNAFSGYFKVIPLNIKAINVNSSKDGHTFDITFDPSYVYVQINPRYISKNLYNYIVQNSFKYSRSADSANKEVQDLNYLSGILEGFSKSQFEGDEFEGFEHYFVPGTIISKFVNEMDTVTIFMIKDLAIFDQNELIKIAGGSFSREREVEVLPGTKTLTELGIVKPVNLDDLTLVTAAEKLQSFRSFLTNNGVGKYSFTLKEAPTKDTADLSPESIVPTPYEVTSKVGCNGINAAGVGARTLAKAHCQELTNIDSAIKKIKKSLPVNTELQAFGSIISEQWSSILPFISTAEDRISFFQDRKTEINNYYGSNPLAASCSWSLYKTLSIIFRQQVRGRTAPNSTNTAELTQAINMIIKAAIVDLYLQKYYPYQHAEILGQLANTTEVQFNRVSDQITELLDGIKTKFASAKEHYSYIGQSKVDFRIFNQISAASYIQGINFFFSYVIKPLILEDIDYSNKNSNYNTMFLDTSISGILKDLNLEKNLQVLEDLGKLKYPLSCETPYFVLNGHIGKISDASAVSGDSYSRSVTISGTGLELPMKSHQIYIDLSAGGGIYQNLSRMIVSNATPIAAALSMMALHLPDYPQITKRDTTLRTIRDQRNFNLFTDGLGNFVDRGTVLFKKPTADADADYFLLAPIHYIDKSYLKVIKSTFDTVIVATNQILTDQRSINDGSIYDNLKSFLSNSSMYSFYIDEFGSMKVRFEVSAAAQTSSTILSPIVSDDTLFSLSLSSDQSQIATLVEILPKPLSALSGQAQTLFYSRATPPDIVDAYGLYKVLELGDLLTGENRAKFFNFLEAMAKTFEEALENVRVDYNKTAGKNSKKELLKPVARPTIIKYEGALDSLKEKVLDSAYTSAEEAAKNKKDKEDAEKEAAAASSARASTSTSTGTASSTDTGTAVTPVKIAPESAPDHCVDGAPAATAATPAAPAATQNAATTPEKSKPAETPATKEEAYKFFFMPGSGQGELQPDYKQVMYNAYENYADYVPLGTAIVPFKLSTGLNIYASPQIDSDYKDIVNVLGANFTYTDYVRYKIAEKLEKLYATNFNQGGIFYLGSLAEESVITLVNVLSTLFTVGISTRAQMEANITSAGITNSKSVKNYISWVIKYTKLFYVPSRLKDLDQETKDLLKNKSFVVSEKDSRRLPYNNFSIQELSPRKISADYFRYGLRRLQQNDYYANDSKLTDFRAETLRKMYEYPMKTASISVMFNAMYKIGNTVLVATEHSPNNKGTYVNLGLKRMIQTINLDNLVSSVKGEPRNYNLFLRVDDLVAKDGLNFDADTNTVSKVYSKLTGIKNNDSITEIDVINHFKDAINFMMNPKLNPKSLPVPSDAYVPLYGIYSKRKSPAVTKYLEALVKFYITAADDDYNYIDKFGEKGYTSLYENIENAIIEIYKEVFGDYTVQEFSLDYFNHLNNLLKPQSYHVYQYYINSLTHSWGFGRSFTTNISGTFGIPCLMTYVPSDDSFDFGHHIIGHITTRGANHYFNDYGTPNGKLTQNITDDMAKNNNGKYRNENILYRFSEEQLIREEKFYKSKYRYNLEYILEKIRRKHLMPDVYGSLIFYKDKPKESE